MVFSSIIFLFFFLPIVLSVYFLIKKEFRNLFLLLASLAFYFWGEGKYVFVMIAYMFFNYYFGVYIEKYHERNTQEGDRKAKYVLIISLLFNLGVFAFYKYFNFMVDNLNYLIGFAGFGIRARRVHLPIGISFFTFQALSYVIDVYRRDVKAQKSLINFSMYKAFFPQLIAGPIVRYRDIAGQVERRTTDANLFSSGVQKFTIGLGKKVIIANTLATVADRVFGTPLGSLSSGAAWLGVLCYSLQIYFDFSGYSDMAIGLGRMFGFHFLENFNYPYVSLSIKEFWRRWHISLSSWFRDYLYIPLGGNKVKPVRVYINLLIVFFLCGLWHGASWTFVIWGLWHGVFLVLERTRIGGILLRMPTPLRLCYTWMVVIIGWVFFRTTSVTEAVLYLKAMFGLQTASVTPTGLLNTGTTLILVLALVASTPAWKIILDALKGRASEEGEVKPPHAVLLKFAHAGLLFLILVVSAAMLSANTYNPFIYFRF